jgi:hypothetical protein
VRTEIDNLYKKIIYLHILPNPSLSIGDPVVKGVTVLGSIYVGQGHVHLTEKELVVNQGSSGIDINPIRPEGGLLPYIDPYPPVINSSSLQFRVNGTSTQLPANQLNGKVDIIIRIDEKNGTSSIYQNNGTYIAGYRIWNADTSAILFEPDDSGVKYKFDRQPGNSYVHQVFVQGVATLGDPIYILTNGDGASNVNQSNIVSDNYLDTDLFAEGDYLLEIFTEDTRLNTDKKFFPISISKNPPQLLTVLSTGGNTSLEISWSPFLTPTLKGYRIYYSGNADLTDWSLAADETMLDESVNSVSFNSTQEFLNPTDSDVYYFYVTAIDSSGNESQPSDIYSRSSATDETGLKKILIVDGFDRFGGLGSWNEPFHSFNTNYFRAISSAADVLISSCSNEAVIENKIFLTDYDIVFWFVGDESRSENTLITLEQAQLAEYLENGGRLFISGDDIGFDLDLPHSKSEFTDTLFYRHYLNARLEHTGAPLAIQEAAGESNTIFEGLTLNFGQLYQEDSPDDIEPIHGAIPIFNYAYKRLDDSTYRKGGIAYTGTFGESDLEGKVVYLSFAAETISPESQMNFLMMKVLQYFDVVTSIEDEENRITPKTFSLEQNYPNPFNPTTNIRFSVAEPVNVSLKIYDILGREAAVLINEIKPPGIHNTVWDASSFSSGVYFAVLKAGKTTLTKSMLLLK